MEQTTLPYFYLPGNRDLEHAYKFSNFILFFPLKKFFWHIGFPPKLFKITFVNHFKFYLKVLSIN